MLHPPSPITQVTLSPPLPPSPVYTVFPLPPFRRHRRHSSSFFFFVVCFFVYFFADTPCDERRFCGPVKCSILTGRRGRRGRVGTRAATGGDAGDAAGVNDGHEGRRAPLDGTGCVRLPRRGTAGAERREGERKKARARARRLVGGVGSLAPLREKRGRARESVRAWVCAILFTMIEHTGSRMATCT